MSSTTGKRLLAIAIVAAVALLLLVACTVPPSKVLIKGPASAEIKRIGRVELREKSSILVERRQLLEPKQKGDGPKPSPERE